MGCAKGGYEGGEGIEGIVETLGADVLRNTFRERAMPAQLLARLNRYLDPQHARTVNAREADPRVDNPAPPPPPATADNPPAPNVAPHWPGGFGNAMANVQCVMIHETSGWPSYASAGNFKDRFLSLQLEYKFIPAVPATPTTPLKPAKWITPKRGIGPQYFVDPNGTAFVMIGPEDLAGAPRQTWHGENLNQYALGIENGDTGDSDVEPGNGLGPRWWRLSNEPSDLTGMKVYLVLHPGFDPDAVLIWIARFPQFRGPGDIDDGANPVADRRLGRHPNWKNMLFTERNYRSLVLLCRLLAEQNGLPRNFPLLPYVDNGRDQADAGIFRQLILSDQRRDAIAVKLGTTTADIQANAAAYNNFYTAARRNRIWRRFFGDNPDAPGPPDMPCFRGILSHDINGSHPCPGPLFDWYRFAREIYDWWWYPFDMEPVGVVTILRSYLQARRSTQLIDYYWDSLTTAAEYNALHPPLSVTERFLLPDLLTPIYAMANGVVVAARFALDNNPARSGFLLVRHEVFHRAAANHIDYDAAPTFVWSLTYFLSNAGFTIPAAPPALPAATSDANPSWLNRFNMRLRECELAVPFHNANPGNAALNTAWAHNPSGAGPRLSTGQEIERDAAAYRAIATELIAGRHALLPLEANAAPTPVRVTLGDFVGNPNRMNANQDGIQVEIFSLDQLPVPGATQRAVSASAETWWPEVSAAIRNEAAAGMNLPANGIAWHYTMTNFLEWINQITWSSEWQKYGVIDAAGAPAPVPARPITRRVT
jgi:hypothetical protein